MTKYIENVNAYLSQMKIKQAYVSLKSGMEKNKLSRILSGAQDINSTDMEKIADALGKKMEYFLADNFFVPQIPAFSTTEIAFYAGNPSKQQEEFAKQLIELIENADEVLGAKERFMMAIGE